MDNGFVTDSITVNITDLANILQEWITQGSKRYQVSWKDLKVCKSPNGQGAAPVNVREALLYGARFFDAILWFAQDVTKRTDPVNPSPANLSPFATHKTRPYTPAEQATLKSGDPKEYTTMSHNDSQLAKYIFVVYLHLMTRANYPEGTGKALGKDIPKFQKLILPDDVSGEQILSALATFKLENVEPTWIKLIDTEQLGTETRNRLGLGVAGYRLLQPFKIYPFIDLKQAAFDVLTTEEKLLYEQKQSAYKLARTMALAPYSWALHPITRSPTLIQRFGSLNHCLENLLLACFTDAELDIMVKARILYAKPTLHPNADGWKAWTMSMLPDLNDTIFP